MKYLKLSKIHSKQKYIQLCLLLFFVSFHFACKKECVDVKTLYNAYYQAVVYPEQFDNYVQDNMSEFDNDFFSFLDEKIDETSKLIDEGYEFCDNAHTQGSDFWHQCYDEVAENYGGFLGALTAIKETTKYNRSFEQTDYGAYMILSKQIIGANDYEYLMKLLVPDLEAHLTYEFCEKKCFI